MSTFFILKRTAQLQQAFEWITDLFSNSEFPLQIKVEKFDPKRTLSQNALFHMWCQEIADHFVNNGRAHFQSGIEITKDTVKENLKQTFLGTEPKTRTNLQTGEVIQLEEVQRTRNLSTAKMYRFMVLIDQWALGFNIFLTKPEESEYMAMRQELGEVA